MKSAAPAFNKAQQRDVWLRGSIVFDNTIAPLRQTPLCLVLEGASILASIGLVLRRVYWVLVAATGRVAAAINNRSLGHSTIKHRSGSPLVSRVDQDVGSFRAWQAFPVSRCKPFVLLSTWPVARPPVVARYSTWW